MNRRKFFGALLAPVAAVVAAKVLPTGYAESAQTKLKRWFTTPLSPLLAKPATYPASMYEINAHRMHQEHLTKWLRDKVDNAVFEMMTGELDGQKS